MRRNYRKLLGFLLACVLACLPVSEALAAVQYDVVAGGSATLFPGDSLINTGELPVMLDGQPVVQEVPGTWENSSEDLAYTVALSEDGMSIVLTAVGYVLTVEHGTSEKSDGSGADSMNHYVFPEGEKPEIPQDIAYYTQGEPVNIKADAPAEGKVFSGWTADSDQVLFADQLNPETMISMPGKKVTVTANYQDAQPETPAPEAVPEQQPADGGAPVPEEIQDMNQSPEQPEQPVDGGAPVPEEIQDMNQSPEQLEQQPVDGGAPVPEEVQDMNQGPEQPEQPADGGTPAPEENQDMNQSQEQPEQPADGGTPAPEENQDMGPNPEQLEQQPVDMGMPAPDQGQESIQDQGQEMPQDQGTDPAQDQMQEQFPPENSEQAPIDILTPDGFEPVPVPEIPGGQEVSSDPGQTGSDGTADGGDILIDPDGSNSVAPEGDGASNGDIMTPDLMMPDMDSAIFYTVTVENGVIADSDGMTTSVFEPGTSVGITASEMSADGFPFVEWEVVEGDIIIDAPTSLTTTFVMPESAVLVRATYQSAETQPVTEEQTELVTEAQTQPVTETQTEPVTELQTQPVTETEPVTEPQESVTEPQTELVIEIQTEPVTEPQPVTEPETAAPQYYEVIVENGTGGGLYKVGDLVTLRADLDDGQSVENWEISNIDETSENIDLSVDETGEVVTFTMPEGTVEATMVAATPAPTTYTLTVANGAVIDSLGLTQNADGSWNVPQATPITINANAGQDGETFFAWTATDATGADIDLTAWGIDDEAETITLPADVIAAGTVVNLQAHYEGIEYEVTVNDGWADYDTAVSGNVVTIKADPAPEGMEFDYWSVDSGNVTLRDNYSKKTKFKMPAEDVTVSANYKLKEYRVNVINGYSDQDYYHMGDLVTVYSNYPASGKEFNTWTVEKGEANFQDASRWKTTFEMPAAHVRAVATYKDGPSTNDNLILDIAAGGQYYTGDTIQFTATGAGMGNSNPNPGDYRYRPTGYQIGNVTGSWQSSPYTTSMAIRATGEYTLRVTYGKEISDGNSWTADGTSDTKSVTFRVVTRAAGVQTGDETPLGLVIAIAAVSCILFLILLVIFIRRRKNR